MPRQQQPLRPRHHHPPDVCLAPSHKLSVYQPGLEGGFQASIRGHTLDLADPSSGHALAPTPEDLFVAALASQLAWSARSFLHAHGQPEGDVSVSANWQADGDLPSGRDLDLTVTVSRCAE